MISVVVETVNFETETQDLKFETKTRDFKICAFCQIKKNVVITSKLNFFLFLAFSDLFSLFLTCKYN